MQTPLLALTRRRAGAELESSAATAAGENMRQLVQLRWIAVGGQLVTILAVHFGLGVTLPLAALLGVVAMLALANIAIARLQHSRPVGDLAILSALVLDVGLLTVQLYLSGGAGNPFISLFLLQVVLGAILLRARFVWVLLGLTGLCYAVLSARHVPLIYPPSLTPHLAELQAWGAWISFLLTGALLALFMTRIMRNLRTRDARLAALKAQAIEEDGIIRMGLFASGAAHELSTPLSSLAVILNDWARTPRIARDPDLARDLEEMQGEVGRCKTIVTDILRTVGEPRGEAMGRTPAEPYLLEVAGAWREAHPLTPVSERHIGLSGASLIAEPALRQAIWNMLDNAADASTAAIALVSRREGGALVIAVDDDGPGFPADQLAAVGRPHHSTKGEGHGMGLFLTASVARRLGGRLEAVNRPDGGASVRLILPLAPDQPGGTR